MRSLIALTFFAVVLVIAALLALVLGAPGWLLVVLVGFALGTTVAAVTVRPLP